MLRNIVLIGIVLVVASASCKDTAPVNSVAGQPPAGQPPAGQPPAGQPASGAEDDAQASQETTTGAASRGKQAREGAPSGEEFDEAASAKAPEIELSVPPTTSEAPPSTGNARAASGPPKAKQGEMCAGIAGIQCQAGLYCQMGASHPDAAGVCVKSKH